ncbi:TPA: hypothetical protein ACGU4W_001090 [Vibrio vulnificus]|nr:hypothetical protein [Vibrio vulnificus]
MPSLLSNGKPIPDIKIIDFVHVYNTINTLENLQNAEDTITPILEFGSRFLNQDDYIEDPHSFTTDCCILWEHTINQMNSTPRLLSTDEQAIDNLRGWIANAEDEDSRVKLQSQLDNRLRERNKSKGGMLGGLERQNKEKYGDMQINFRLWLLNVGKFVGLSFVEISSMPYRDFINLANVFQANENYKEAYERDAEQKRKQAEAANKSRGGGRF